MNITPGFVLAMLCVAVPVPGHSADKVLLATPDQMKWAPLASVPGTEWVVLSGDPGKKGRFVFEWRGPAGTKAPPHWHSRAERITMISGTGTVGMGDNIDPQKGKAVPPGTYGVMPGKMHHWFVSDGPFVMLIEGEGPFDIHFVNPADDPTR